MSEPREHYVIAVRRHERVHYLLWFRDDTDGVVTEAGGGGGLLAFPADADARAHAASASLLVSAEQSAYFDLDELAAWVDAPNPYRIRADDLLNAWNLLGDIARSAHDDIALARLLDRKNATYDQLVSCCNIPALGFPVTERLTPAECATVAATLRHGLACFDQALSRSLPDPAPEPR